MIRGLYRRDRNIESILTNVIFEIQVNIDMRST